MAGAGRAGRRDEASRTGSRVRGRLRHRLPPRVRTARAILQTLAGFALILVAALGILYVLGFYARFGLTPNAALVIAIPNVVIAVAAILAARGIDDREPWGWLLGVAVGLIVGVGAVAGIVYIHTLISGNVAFISDLGLVFYAILGLAIAYRLLRSVNWLREIATDPAQTSSIAVAEEAAARRVEIAAVTTATGPAGAPAAAVDRAIAGDGRQPLVTVRGLKKHFPIVGGIFKRQVGTVYAVDGVDFDVYPGEIFSLVGESGCGKTTLGRTLLQLTPPTGGKVVFDGYELEDVDPTDMRPLRRRMQIIFQDPFGSLNPRMPISDIIGEGLLAQGMKNRRERDRKVEDSLETVGLRRDYTRRYPHEFSGGQRQRIGIARALALGPDFVVCDEPVSALDVSIQSQILNLLLDLRRDLNLTYLFISHNLSVVEYFSDRVGVMYLGQIAELGTVEQLYSNPRHPYTVALLSAIPEPDPRRRKKRLVLKGDVPSPAAPPSGCRFHTRCWLRERLGNPERCVTEEPKLRPLDPGHLAACHFAEEISQEGVQRVAAGQSAVETAVAETA